jgi:hypothetical protein
MERKMKVETDLKSGAFAQDAANAVSSAANQVASLVTNANQQAADLTNTVIRKSTAVWNALVS